MVTQKANTFVVPIHGNFDDAQTGVKKIFSDKELAKEMDEKGFQFSLLKTLSSGRLVRRSATMCMLMHSYVKTVRSQREKINVAVPGS